MSNPEMRIGEFGFKYGYHKTKMDLGLICIKIKWAEVWTGWEWELLHMRLHTQCQLQTSEVHASVREALPASPPTTGSALQGLMTNVSQKQSGLWSQGSANVRLSEIEKEGNEDGGIDLGFWAEDMGWEKRMEPHIQAFKGRVMWEALLWGCGTAGMGSPSIQSQKLFLINNCKSFSLPFFYFFFNKYGSFYLPPISWMLIY